MTLDRIATTACQWESSECKLDAVVSRPSDVLLIAMLGLGSIIYTQQLASFVPNTWDRDDSDSTNVPS
jgi:hypothetical protein